jgi:hypothetical protein
VRVAFLVILGKEKANAQGEKMNSEEKKQHPIFGVPPQKQKNNSTHCQPFNFHRSSFISPVLFSHWNKIAPVSIIGCCATIFSHFRPRTGRASSTWAPMGSCRKTYQYSKSVCYNNLVQVWPAPGRYRTIQPF